MNISGHSLRTILYRKARTFIASTSSTVLKPLLPQSRTCRLTDLNHKPFWTLPPMHVNRAPLSFGSETQAKTYEELGYDKTTYQIPLVAGFQIPNVTFRFFESIAMIGNRIAIESLPSTSCLDSGGVLREYFRFHRSRNLDRGFLLSMPWQKSYHLWLQYALPRLQAWETLTDRADWPILIPENSPAFVFQTTNKYRERHPEATFMVLPRSQVNVKDAIIVAPTGFRDLAHPMTVAWLQHTFPQTSHSPSPKRLFLIRRETVERRILNIDDLEPLLSRFGFEVVDLTGVDWQRQIDMFAGADLIIGPHGGAFSNMVFCRPDAAIIEIIGGSHYRPCFRFMADTARLRYGVLPARSVGVHITIEPHILETFLKNI